MERISDMWIVDVSDAMFSSYLVLGKMDQVQVGPHIKKRTEERGNLRSGCQPTDARARYYSTGGDQKKWTIISNAVYEGHLFLTLGFVLAGTVISAVVVMFDMS